MEACIARYPPTLRTVTYRDTKEMNVFRSMNRIEF